MASRLFPVLGLAEGFSFPFWGFWGAQRRHFSPLGAVAQLFSLGLSFVGATFAFHGKCPFSLGKFSFSMGNPLFSLGKSQNSSGCSQTRLSPNPKTPLDVPKPGCLQIPKFLGSVCLCSRVPFPKDFCSPGSFPKGFFALQVPLLRNFCAPGSLPRCLCSSRLVKRRSRRIKGKSPLPLGYKQLPGSLTAALM